MVLFWRMAEEILLVEVLDILVRLRKTQNYPEISPTNEILKTIA